MWRSYVWLVLEQVVEWLLEELVNSGIGIVILPPSSFLPSPPSLPVASEGESSLYGGRDLHSTYVWWKGPSQYICVEEGTFTVHMCGGRDLHSTYVWWKGPSQYICVVEGTFTVHMCGVRDLHSTYVWCKGPSQYIRVVEGTFTHCMYGGQQLLVILIKIICASRYLTIHPYR